jgi:hypothetical protein
MFFFRSHSEPVSGSVVPRHLMDALQEKLNDAEAALRREKEERHRENVCCLN